MEQNDVTWLYPFHMQIRSLSWLCYLTWWEVISGIFSIFGKCWKVIVEWLLSCLTFLEDFCLKSCKWGRMGITLWSFHTKFSLVFFIHGLNPLFRPLKEVLLSTKTQIYANLSRCPWLKLHFRIHEQLNLLQSKRTRRTEYSK